MQPRITSHGINSFISCFHCNEELTDDFPGKIITWKKDGRNYREIVCKEHFMRVEYIEFLAGLNKFEVRNYPNYLNII
jgi:uncharacterized CHY-type Zn-finger protein